MRWQLAEPVPVQVRRLALALQDLPELRSVAPNSNSTASNRTASDSACHTLASLLIQRGITEAEAAARYLNPSIDHLHAPLRMTGVSAAVDRLDAAIERKEPMLIYGDYDVDGTMAIIILKTAIELCGGAADFHVPHRIREGYDLRDDVIERAAAAGIRLIISVDMGIRAFAPAETAQRLGVDLIVTDHHLPGADGVPKAICVVNPNQEGCTYPYKQLCGAGVAFKVAQALMQRRLDPKDHVRMLRSFMKVVAIATIADAVPLTGENRIFAKLGLDELRTAVNPGLKALLEVAQISSKRPPSATEVAFRIAPRINAAGRMDIARDVIDLFSIKDADQARLLAGKLDRLNAERQEEERRIVKAVEERIAGDPALSEAYCIVVDGEGWHRGVIGIAATRVVERYHRPAIVISRDKSDGKGDGKSDGKSEEAFGSGRSIRPFHLLEAVEASHALFTRYGGHSHACGFSMPAANIAQLRSELDAFARTRLTPADFDPVLDVEAELHLDEITPTLYRVLRMLEPYGTGNHEPAFISRSVQLIAPPKILKDKHIKLKLKAAECPEPVQEELSAVAISVTPSCHPDSAAIRRSEKTEASVHAQPEKRKFNPVFDALGWHMAEKLQSAPLLAGDAIDIAFTITHNDHDEFGGLELSLRDFKSQSPPVDGNPL
ncbi:MAG: single-stranded-DNA-specific exonuclease RecJ [Candidatus Sulfotelmatobacter sp.]